MHRYSGTIAAILLSLAVASCGGTGSSHNTPSTADVFAAGNGAGGILQVGEQQYEMRYAYVSDVAMIPELRYTEWPDRVLSILVADRPVDPSEAYVNGLDLSGMVFNDYVGVRVTIDPGTGQALNGNVVFPFDMSRPIFLDQIVRDSGVRFTPDPVAGDGLMGVLATTRPIGSLTQYSFDIAIGTDNISVSVPHTVLEGNAAHTSPQGVAYLSYIDAIVRNDPAAMNAVTTDWHPKTIEPGDEFFENVVPAAPLPESIAKIYVYETESVIWITDADGPEQFGHLRLVDGRWLVEPYVRRQED
jgi:hypothetical protein